MKKLSLHFFLLLLWCNIGFSNDIKEFEIDGIKIYDNIYDILTDEIISENIEKLKIQNSTEVIKNFRGY